MFREIKLHPDETNLHRFLYKDSNGSVKDLQMLRLTFGVSCSPFVATQVLRHLAQTHTLTHLSASITIQEAFYVDDFLSGAATVEEADSIRKELCDLLNTAGMRLKKWRSNSQSFMKTVPTDLHEHENLLIAPSDRPLKTLGVHWNVETDQLSVAVPTIVNTDKVTK